MRRAAWLLVAACGSGPTIAPDATTTDASMTVDAQMVDASIDAELSDAPDAAPPDPFTSLQALPGTCSADEWCWKWPTPSGNRYYDVVATGPDNIWLLGGGGALMQWNGSVWHQHTPPSQPGQEYLQRPLSMAGRAADDMWLIWGTTVQHWDGAVWTIFEQGPLNVVPYYQRLYADPTGDVWLTSIAGVKRSHAGGPFEAVNVTGEGYTGIWGTSADFFASRTGGIDHCVAGACVSVFRSNTRFGTAYQGFENDLWASGGAATLLHWDGETWAEVETGINPARFIVPIAVLAPDDVWWFAGYSFLHWNGTAIEVLPFEAATQINAAAVIAGTWWLVGDDGAVYTKAGVTTLASVIAPVHAGHLDLWGTSDDDMYLAGGTLQHWDGSSLTTLPVPAWEISGTGSELFTVDQRFDVTANEYTWFARHFDGAAWTTTELRRIPGAGSGIWWINDVRAMGPGEALLVANDGVVMRYAAGTWTTLTTSTTEHLWQVWAPDADHAWITGRHGTLVRWDRANPTVVVAEANAPATTNDLGAIGGAGGVMWIANASGAVQSVWRGSPTTGWTTQFTGVAVDAIAAASANNVVFASRQINQVSRWNGTECVLEAIGSDRGMTRIFQAPGGRMWLTDGRGLVQHP